MYGYFFYTSYASQWSAHETVPSQVATQQIIDKKTYLWAGEEPDLNQALLHCSQVRYRWATSSPKLSIFLTHMVLSWIGHPCLSWAVLTWAALSCLTGPVCPVLGYPLSGLFCYGQYFPGCPVLVVLYCPVLSWLLARAVISRLLCCGSYATALLAV